MDGIGDGDGGKLIRVIGTDWLVAVVWTTTDDDGGAGGTPLRLGMP
jgi:hypothetical protein